MAGHSTDRITIHCPTCQKRFLVDAKLVGREVKCAACQSRFRVTQLAKPPTSVVRSESVTAAAKDASENGWQDKVYQWGLGLIALGLVGLILPAFGLQLARLRALGEAQWMVLVVVVIAGCAAVLWSRRQRPKLGIMIAGGALTAMLLFAYLGFWRDAVDSPTAQDTASTSQTSSPSAEIKQLAVTFENVKSFDDFPLLFELLKDAVPEATNSGSQLQGKPDPKTGKMVAASQRFTIGPVAQLDAVLSRIQFGKATLQSGNKLVVDVTYPLPPHAASIQHRLEYGRQQLRSGDPQRQAAGLRLLESLDPLDRREEIAAELVAMLTRPNPPFGLTQCLLKWGTPKQVPEIAALLDSESANHNELLLILSTISPDDAVRQAVKLMPKHASLAEHTLQQLGPRSEGPVVTLLTNSDENVRVAACRILLVVGTTTCIEPLEKLRTDTSPQVAAEAQRAVEVIRERMQKSAAESKGK